MAYWALTCALSLFLLIYQHACFNFTKIVINTHAILKFYLLKLEINYIIILFIIITCYYVLVLETGHITVSQIKSLSSWRVSFSRKQTVSK